MRAREMVVEDPEILRGAPVLRGTRIPVYDIAAAVAAGQSPAHLKVAYPDLDDDRLALASLYAEATRPAAGRRLAVEPTPASSCSPSGRWPGVRADEGPAPTALRCGLDISSIRLA